MYFLTSFYLQKALVYSGFFFLMIRRVFTFFITKAITSQQPNSAHCSGLIWRKMNTEKANTFYLWSLVLRWRWGRWGWSAVSARGEWTDGTGYDLLRSGLGILGYSPLDRSYLVCKNEHTHTHRGFRGNMNHFSHKNVKQTNLNKNTE